MIHHAVIESVGYCKADACKQDIDYQRELEEPQRKSGSADVFLSSCPSEAEADDLEENVDGPWLHPLAS